jgi:hypothetical protein
LLALEGNYKEEYVFELRQAYEGYMFYLDHAIGLLLGIHGANPTVLPGLTMRLTAEINGQQRKILYPG